MTPRAYKKSDLEWAHRLNEAHAVALSSLEQSAFAALIAKARFARVVDIEAALLLAFDQKPTDYSPNFDWFAARYSDFLYVDRIVVAPSARRQGLARTLYETVFAEAKAAGFKRIACEINADPPNPASDAFHTSLGFAPVGEAFLEDRGKTVRYFIKLLE